HMGRHRPALFPFRFEVLFDLLTRVDEDLRWHAVEHLLNALPPRFTVDHHDVQIAGLTRIPPNDGSRDEKTYPAETGPGCTPQPRSTPDGTVRQATAKRIHPAYVAARSTPYLWDSMQQRTPRT
ncbi:MAG: hypothetical protein H0V47_05345, partial [Chloroflexia bacterium]|nr:hypothetical protein [Chloroflexia bacterium]